MLNFISHCQSFYLTWFYTLALTIILCPRWWEELPPETFVVSIKINNFSRRKNILTIYSTMFKQTLKIWSSSTKRLKCDQWKSERMVPICIRWDRYVSHSKCRSRCNSNSSTWLQCVEGKPSLKSNLICDNWWIPLLWICWMMGTKMRWNPPFQPRHPDQHECCSPY